MVILDLPVADWWFEDETEITDFVGPERVRSLINMCEKCISILKRYELLSPSKILLSKNWIFNENVGEQVKWRRVQKADISIDYPSHNENELATYFLDWLKKEQGATGYVYPCSLQFVGEGKLINKDGVKQGFENVVSIKAMFIGALIVDVITYSTAWLPYTLAGEPQQEIYEWNAPRLEKALYEIEAALGVEPIIDDANEFCHINGYRLDNARDIDGEVIPIDEKGRIIG
ncbi:hypothetical protein C1X05_14640 [Laceyella sacchari]|uniref:Uncharacterized protein n=2 Tax=Laceyella TaxID=292635 RepID=A0AA45WPQ6_9BACL|nr:MULTISPECIES: hypothetical protein [Laceyella]AUS09940.1 hypothetical protein C1X05_14640 [Laceyella sacchari]PRZ14900.1 hypothetical protein CLV36_105216 [Laceyella sediminis]SMP22684.1 hypothetical protein SAMN06265361_10495 [Laceyella tengchongensis]